MAQKRLREEEKQAKRGSEKRRNRLKEAS